jgi:hypothetical protein
MPRRKLMSVSGQCGRVSLSPEPQLKPRRKQLATVQEALSGKCSGRVLNQARLSQ